MAITHEISGLGKVSQKSNEAEQDGKDEMRCDIDPSDTATEDAEVAQMEIAEDGERGQTEPDILPDEKHDEEHEVD
jgi:hypothetical protein